MTMLLFSISTFSQSKISEYRMSFFVDKDINTEGVYDIEATIANKGKFYFYIGAQSMDSDNLHSPVGFVISSKELPKFKDCMRQVKRKFEQWKIVAEDNDVKGYIKDFDIKLPFMSGFFNYAEKTHLTHIYEIIPQFVVFDDGVSIVSLEIENIYSINNHFITHKGIMIAFKNVEEIDEFLYALDTSLAIRNSNEKEKTNNLFK